MAKIGVWLIGAQGSLASTVVVGARAIARQLAGGGGLVTELPELAPLPLAGLGDLLFGGWDVPPGALVSRAGARARAACAAPEPLLTSLHGDVGAVEACVRPGSA